MYLLIWCPWQAWGVSQAALSPMRKETHRVCSRNLPQSLSPLAAEPGLKAPTWDPNPGFFMGQQCICSFLISIAGFGYAKKNELSLTIYSNGSQSSVPGQAASVSPGNLSEIHVLRPTPVLQNQKLQSGTLQSVLWQALQRPAEAWELLSCNLIHSFRKHRVHLAWPSLWECKQWLVLALSCGWLG